MPRRLGAALRRAGLAALRGFAAGLLRFSATKGGFDPRLPVISAHSFHAPFRRSLQAQYRPRFQK